MRVLEAQLAAVFIQLAPLHASVGTAMFEDVEFALETDRDLLLRDLESLDRFIGEVEYRIDDLRCKLLEPRQPEDWSDARQFYTMCLNELRSHLRPFPSISSLTKQEQGLAAMILRFQLSKMKGFCWHFTALGDAALKGGWLGDEEEVERHKIDHLRQMIDRWDKNARNALRKAYKARRLIRQAIRSASKATDGADKKTDTPRKSSDIFPAIRN
jgi:hypothetical protein